MTSTDPCVRTTVADGVRTIVLARPAARNALNREMLGEIYRTFDSAAKERTSRVILISGEGSEAFCAGADLKELLTLDERTVRRSFFAVLGEILKAMHRMPKPIISAVHGYALAGGCGLACAADLVFAADDSVFGLPEIKIGMMPMVVLAPLERVVGRRVLTDLVLRGENIDAARALELGLVTQIFPREALHEEARRIAAILAARSPTALRTGTLALREVGSADYVTTIDRMVEEITDLSLGSEASAAIAEFLARRTRTGT